MKNLIYLLLFIVFPIHAQVVSHWPVVTPKPADSLDIVYYAKKRGAQAATQILGLNIGIWAFNRFVTKSDFAYIDTHTIKANLTHKWVWDNDLMGTNMFLHPYQGALSFNSARSQGYNYWTSGLYAFGGSAMWELFLESEYPSFNDMIVTPIGGAALGEVLYRTSDLVLNDRLTGLPRWGSELAGFLISPTRALTRILTGDARRVRTTTGKQFGTPDVNIEVSVGVRTLELEGKILDRGIGAAMNIAIEYGDRFADECKQPYDYFTFKTNLNAQSSQPMLSQLNMLGRLYVTDIVDTKTRFLSWGFYQHFDYYDSDTISGVSSRIPYKLSAPVSLGTGFICQNKRPKNMRIDASLHVNLVLLGATLSDYYVVDKRNYNLASGFCTKTGFNASYKDKINISVNHEFYRMFTWKGYPQDIDWNNIDVHEFNYQGDESRAFLHLANFKMDVKLSQYLFLSYIHYYYMRNTDYRYFDKVVSKTNEGRLMATYKF